jgi:acetyl esterase/lipase
MNGVMAELDSKLLKEVDSELMPILTSVPAWDPKIGIRDIDVIRRISQERSEGAPKYANIVPKGATIEYNGHKIRVQIYAPETTKTDLPCLVWFHGGGYVMGRAEDNWFPTFFAAKLDCIVLSVDYRLAPEYPAPAGIIDGYVALNWVAESAEQLGIDPKRIGIGGLSAGGGIAAAVALYNRDKGGAQPCLQLLLYPMLDYQHDTPSGRKEGYPIWSRKNSIAAWKLYLGENPDEETVSFASPSHALHLEGLPAAYIAVGEVDLFLDENRNYAEKLRNAGVACEFHSFPGVFHAGEAAGYETKVGREMNMSHLAALSKAFFLNSIDRITEF